MGTFMGTTDVANAAASKIYAEAAQKKNKTTEKTIGEPKLSETAAKYYEQLQEKYGDFDFVLVSKEEKDDVQKHAAKYAGKDRTVVLIDEEKIEKMAADEEYRKKYENILTDARTQLEEMAKSFQGNDAVKGFGIKINDNGTASFFAVIDKQALLSQNAQKKRLEEQKADKKQAQKKEQKEAERARWSESLEKKREERKQNVAESKEKNVSDVTNKRRWDVVSANSMEELVKKVQDLSYAAMSDQVMTDAERALGQTIDFRG